MCLRPPCAAGWGVVLHPLLGWGEGVCEGDEAGGGLVGVEGGLLIRVEGLLLVGIERLLMGIELRRGVRHVGMPPSMRLNARNDKERNM